MQPIRLRCLELAVESGAPDPVMRAKQFLIFLENCDTQTQPAKTESCMRLSSWRRLAVIEAPTLKPKETAMAKKPKPSRPRPGC